MVAGGEVGEFDDVGCARVDELAGVCEECLGLVVGRFEAGEVLLEGGLLIRYAGVCVWGKAYH